MISRDVFVLLTLCLFSNVYAVSKSVKYEGPSGKVSNKIGCAAINTDPLFVAMRIHLETGSCQGLTWNDWGRSPTYENGFTYFDKKRTFENPNLLSVPFIADLNPGSLTDGKTVYIEGIPTADFTSFSINLQEGIENIMPEQVALHVSVRELFGVDHKVVIRNNRHNGIWGQREDFTPFFPFSPGVPYNITILYQQNTFKVDVDNKHFCNFEARTSPLDHIESVRVKSQTQLTKVIVKW